MKTEQNLYLYIFHNCFLFREGDYCRYLAEFETGPKRKEAAEKSLVAYKRAVDIANSDLTTTHPIRLGQFLCFIFSLTVRLHFRIFDRNWRITTFQTPISCTVSNFLLADVTSLSMECNFFCGMITLLSRRKSIVRTQVDSSSNSV